MANIHELNLGLLYQVKTFLTYIISTYSNTPTDLSSSYEWYHEPFDIEDLESLKKLIPAANYSFVITNGVVTNTEDYPVGFNRLEYTADIYVIRKTLQPRDFTNRYNIILQGGTDGANADITSMSKICGDLAKWFRVHTQGGKLNNGTSDLAFKCDITNISRMQNIGDFFYTLCSFRALTMESTTIEST